MIKINRNDPCPCGSGRKYKHCCYTRSAADTYIEDLQLEKNKEFKYLFDFGDDLVHGITVVEILEEADPDTRYPRVVASVGEAPDQYNW